MADPWEDHKEKMTTLFLKQGRTLDEVRDEMEAGGFHASKANYERRFKKWGVRKRSQDPKLKWTSISRKIEMRKAVGKQSEVYDNGIKLPSKKLCKEISRYCLPTMYRPYSPEDSPKTPEGILICTPAPSPDNTHLLRGIPWFKFLSSRGIEWDPNSDLASIAMMSVAVSSNITPLLSTPITSGPTMDVLYGLCSAITNWTANLIPNSQDSQVRKVHSYLRAVLPDPAHNDELELAKNKSKHFDPHTIALFINIFVYLLSNGLFEDAVYNKLVDIFRQPGMTDFLQTLLSNKTPTIEAFAEKIFIASVKSQDSRIIEIALKAGVDPNTAVVEFIYTPLSYVAEKGNFLLVQLLLGAGADVNALPCIEWVSCTALQAAAKSGNMDVVRLLLSVGADVNAPPAAYRYGYTALQEAARNDNMEIVRFLIAAGADVNAPPAVGGFGCRTALQAAAGNGKVDMIDLLLNAGADVNAPLADRNGRTALQAAAWSGNIKIVELLLDVGADVNAPPTADGLGYTALQAAAENCNIDIIRLLLDAGADVNAPPGNGWYGRTALQAAAGNDDIEIVNLLLLVNANVNAPPADNSGRTALQAAAENGDIEIVELLLKAGADVNALPANSRGVTALQAAAIGGYTGIVLKLLDCNADIDAPGANDDGRTALEGAAEHGRLDVVQILLNAGVQLSGPGQDQYERAIDFSAEEGHHAVERLIRDYAKRDQVNEVNNSELDVWRLTNITGEFQS